MGRLLLLALVFLSAACGESSGDTGESAGGASSGGGAVGGGSGSAATGGSGAGIGGGATGGGSLACEGIPRDTGKTPAGEDLCQIIVKTRERCNPDAGEPAPIESSLEECYAEGDVTRVDGCFLELYERERETCDGNDDWDFSVAIAKANPEIVTATGLACLEAHDEGCGPEIQGPLRDCFTRFEECGTFEDLCLSIYALAPTWSSQLPECLTRPCEEIEDCLYDLLGTPEDARD